ncbi:Ankyrin-2 [Chlorella vulgaris]
MLGVPVKALLEAGADVAAFDADGWQPLHLAAFQSTTAAEAEAVISLLLNAGADVFATRDRVTEQAIHLVVQNPSPGAASAAIRLLCVAGASPDVSAGDYDMRPLHLVVHNRDSSAAAAADKALLEAGADVNAFACGGLTPLHAAAGCEYANVINAVVPLLLGAGADVNERDVRDRTALHHAVLNEDPDAARMAVKVLVAAGADVNAEDEDGKQPLHVAAECSKFAIVQALLAHGADVEAECESGQTPLHYAAKSDSGDSAADCITAVAGARYYEFDDNILEFDGPANLTEFRFINGAMLADYIQTLRDNLMIAKRRVLDEAATSALSDVTVQYPLHAAARMARTAEDAEQTIKQLLAAGYSVNQPDDKGNCPLHCAAIDSSPGAASAAIRLLVAAVIINWPIALTWPRLITIKLGPTGHSALMLFAGADVTARDANDMEALHMAAFHTSSGDMTAVIALLLAAGARVDAPTFPQSGYTPTHLAVRNPDPEAAGAAVRLLVAAGASPPAAAVHEVGFQPLHIVHLNPNPAAASAALKALLEDGADVNGLRSDGVSPLHENAGAARQAHVMAAIIPLLLEAGADPNATDEKGCTSLHFSAFNTSPSAAKVAIDLLMAAGSDIHARDLGHWQPLHLAAKCCGADNISALLRYGADVNAKGDMDFTPLHYAVVRNTSPELVSECITTLMAAGADIAALDNLNQQAIHLAAINKPGSGEAQCEGGLTPLHYASVHNPGNAVDCIDALVAAGASIAAVNCWAVGDTKAVATAITALLKAGASGVHRGAQGGQPLHYAALAHTAEGATAAIKTLLAVGAVAWHLTEPQEPQAVNFNKVKQ